MNKILSYLDELFPNPKCELNYTKDYELLIAVMLSAQTTDKKVNKVTEILFNKYPTINDLKDAKINDIEDIIKEKGWIQISDEGAIKEVVMKILEANPQSIADYKAGKDKALGFLVGQAMKETKGKANPQMLNKMFLEELKK